MKRSEKKVGGLGDIAPSILELREGLKDFYVGLVNQVNTSLMPKLAIFNVRFIEN
jgi:hypothetical protein